MRDDLLIFRHWPETAFEKIGPEADAIPRRFPQPDFAGPLETTSAGRAFSGQVPTLRPSDSIRLVHSAKLRRWLNLKVGLHDFASNRPSKRIQASI